MNNNLDKALPTIPKQQDNSFRLTTTLSVEARVHIRRFILHTLEEESTNLTRDDWDTEQLSWTSGLLDALDAMGESIGSGGWLTGVRRSRKARILRKMDENSRKVKALSDETDLEVEESSSSSSSDLGVESSKEAIKQLRHLLSKPTVPTPKPSSKHLLLTAAAFGAKITISSEDTESNLIPSDIGCRFSPDFFLLPPSGGDIAGLDVEEGIVLCGLDEWDVYSGENKAEPPRIVGGTFSFKGVTSAAQHLSLCKILRLSIYVYLSLILEQHLLSDSHVKLNLPKQRHPRALPHTPVANDHHPQISPNSGSKSKKPVSPSGVWSFFSKRTEDLLHRATTFGSRSGAAPRVPLDQKEDAVVSQDTSLSPQSSHQRTRTFAFLPDSISWTTKARKEIDDLDTIPPYRATIRRIEKSRDLLSTSAGLTFPLPSLLASLAEKEERDPSCRLTGAERSGLNSILGWEGREARGKGMAGIQGFVRHQDICVLYSEHVLPRPGRSASVATKSDIAPTSSTISSATTVETTTQASSQCGGRARWMCFQYYSRKNRDKTLGEAITRMCSVAEDPCGNRGCQSKRGDHELRFIHGRVRIAVNITSLEVSLDDDYIEMWESCRECGEKTTRSRMSDGTFLLSFGKYLELLIYSPALHVLHPPLCEHTNTPTDSPDPPSKMSSPGLNICRHFSYGTHRITFSLSAIEDVFDIHVPRLQLVKPSALLEGATTASSTTTGQSPVELDTSKKDLRKEIMTWWQGISEHMDRLEEVFVHTDDLKALLKSLPRLPSSDEAYEDYAICDPDATPKPSISGLPSVEHPEQKAYFGTTASTISLPAIESSPRDQLESDQKSSMSSSSSSLPPTPQNIDNLQLLSNIRHDFQREEQSLYAQLSQSPLTSLNNVRRSFITTARGAKKRLSAWEKKHLPKDVSLAESLSACEPDWWDSSCHAVPGGSIIVREGDWGSIIAFTLSSQDFQKELASMSSGKPSNSSLLPLPTISSSESRPSMFSKSSYRIFSSSRPSPDPDDGQVVWHEDETCSAVISRKDHPRDPSALLSLRDVLRKAPADVANTISPSRFAMPARGGIPPSAWAKPAVEINTLAVVGQIDTPEQEGLAGKMLQEVESTLDTTSSRIATSGSSIYAPSTSSISFETHIRRGKALSLISDSDSSDGTVTPTDTQESENPSPPSSSKDTEQAATPRTADESSSHFFMNASLTGSIAHVMRYMLNSNEQHTPSPARNTHHGLLSLESPAIDEQPHIKYDWTIGKRLKFSCTVYYAKQFDTLRRRCGIEDVFLKSMEKSYNWMAEGGKSKSNFWKTSDDRFIIKTLVNAWNVADLQALIELCPSYFRYMDSTAGKPTVLAKLLGSYTIEIRNLETATTLAKSDLVVMENLFYDKKIVKTFDLKGIQGRKVKAKSYSTGFKTLFDGEWIEGQQRALTLLYPHSKLALQEAIKSDSDYLSKSNIMDYSLLLGIDVERKQIACGLVDTIGSYTFAKTLEYKAKYNLQSGKEVTVIPPNEYQERFVSAMDIYFLACPDKWSKPFDNTKINSDPNLLPSVL